MKKILLSAIILASFGSFHAQTPTPVGTIVNNFTLTDINGTSHDLFSYLDAGKMVVIDVSATWCGPCWSYHLSGALNAFYNAHGPTSTANDAMVFFVEGDPGTTLADLNGTGTNTQGNWVTGENMPILNLSTAASFENSGLDIAYYPVMYVICPNRTVLKSGNANSIGTLANLNSYIGDCPAPASQVVDAAALSYEGSLVHCQGSYTPSVKIQNNGLNPLTTATVTITQNGSTVSTGNYSGSLATYGFATVNCSPITNFMGGALAVTITTANDANVANNTVNASVSAAQVAASQYVTVNITTDAYATETSWTIKNPAGTTVASGGGFGPNLTAAGQTVETPVNATLTPNTCYTFEILDAYGDGILGNYGNGGYSIVDAVGNVLASGGAFGASEKKIFKTGVAGLNEMETIALNVFPNPASDLVNVTFEGQNTDYSISLMDIQGRVISSREIANASGEQVVSFSTENVAKGSYIVTVTSNGATTTKNVVIK